MTAPFIAKHVNLPTCTDQLLWDIWFSSYHLPTLTVADEIGLFSFIGDREVGSEEVENHFQLSFRAAEALLGILASLGYLAQRQGKFSLSETARNFLSPASPFYWGGLLRVVRDIAPSHASLKEAIIKDTIHKSPSHGPSEAPLIKQWEKGDVEPAVAGKFTGLMHSHSFPAAMGLARQGFFNGVRRMLDVAGGSGCFCIAMAHFHPEIRCSILELPPVCKLAEEYVRQYGVQDQIDTIPADMFRDPFPTGYDAVLFANIFHDWTEDQCIHLGKKAFHSLPSGGRIFLHEMLLNDGKDGPVPAASFSMIMLSATKGKQFAARELEAILRNCGFVDVAVRHSYGYYSLVHAKKP